MVDPTAYLPKTGVELADVVRRFAPEYTSQYGQVMMPSQKKALSHIAACCTEALGGRLYRSTTATKRSGAFIAAATGRVRSVMEHGLESGSSGVKPMGYHPHVHMLITGGGISPDGEHWEPARGEFLVPVGVLSRKVAAKFRNARILAVDETHVTFRFKDRSTNTWQTMRLGGVEFLRRFLQHVLPRGFHKVRYYGLWHHSKRDLSNRAWLLLILQKPTGTVGVTKIADLLEALDQLAEINDGQDMGHEGDDNIDHEADSSCCPHCGSTRTTFLGDWPQPRMP